MLLSTAVRGLSGRFTPMPFGLHIGFCVLATAVFLTVYFRHKSLSALIWALICDATLILQFYGDKTTALGVGICELVLFGILLWLYIKERPGKKAAEQDASPDDPGDDDRSDIEKLVKSEMQNLADGSDDIISNAFEDDRP